ncbi:conjugal transfer protein, partial [Bifidobacterium adolescentis]
AWKNYQEDREDIKNAIDGAVKRGQERHDTLHQDMQDTQTHLNQMHADMKETHDELKTRHDAFAASSHQWHQSFIAALKDANSKTGQQGGSSVATGTHGTTAGTNAGTTVTGVNGTTGTVRTAADTGTNGAATGSVTASGDQTAASTGALTKSEYGQLAQTGIGISLACAAILLLAGLAYAMKTFVQYKRETSED